MTELRCLYYNCIHHDMLSGICQLQAVTVEEIECGECYESVTEQADYQTEYWIRCMDKDQGTYYKEKKKGKRFETEGLVLYTQEKLPPESEWKNPELRINVTEEKTGMLFSLHKAFYPESRKVIDEYIKNAVPFSELEERAESYD